MYSCISVSKKSNYKFRHAGRLLRNGAEFRILRGKMYEGTSTEQKAKNAKSGLDSMSKPLLQSLRQRIRVATSLYTREAQIGLFNLYGVFQPTLSTV